MKLSDSVALGLPSLQFDDRQRTAAAVTQARRREREVEVRLGVGPTSGALPARVLAHATCVAEVLKTDIPRFLGPATRIYIFSSAPKTGLADGQLALGSIATFGMALREAGVSIPIRLELADQHSEVPADLPLALNDEERRWLANAAGRSNNMADAVDYAREHAGRTMFGDLDDADVPVRVTVGSVPEARFWAFRARLRSSALAAGLSVAPAVALILKACRVPWYSRTGSEPLLAPNLTTDNAITSLEDAANPALGGNAGIKREARAIRRFAGTRAVQKLSETITELRADVDRVSQLGFELGPNATLSLTTGGRS